MKFFRRAVYLLSILVPLSLLVDTKATFYSGIDWDNNRWLIAYFGEYFRHHFCMPTELNTAVGVGMATPMFYGYLLYPILGFLAAFIGGDLALRLGCLLMVALQFYALLCAGREVFRHRGLTYAVAVTVIWSTYALTNLYNRSAIPEYFATGSLMATIGFAVAAAAESSGVRRPFYVWMAAVSAILAMGMHPPTAVMSGVFLAALAVLFAGVWTCGERRVSRVGIVAGFGGTMLGALILSPWFYLTLRIGPKLTIWANPFTILFYPERSDSLLGRLSPSPYDWLSTQRGTVDVSTPYLEAPIAFGLLILLGWFLAIRIRSSRAVTPMANDLLARAARLVVPMALGWFVFLLTLSLSHALADHFLFLGPYLQFAYRLVSHINATLLVAVFAAGAIARQTGALANRQHQGDVVAGVCITIAAMALAVKLSHGSAVAVDQASAEYGLIGDPAPLVIRGGEYLVDFYATPAAVQELGDVEARSATRVAFAVGQNGSDFGQVETAQVRLDQAGWVLTNAVVFPWSRVWVNGTRWGGGELRRHGPFLALHLPAGSADLRWEWHPDPVWAALHTIGQIAFCVLMLITLFWPLARWTVGRAHGNRSGPPWVLQR